MYSHDSTLHFVFFIFTNSSKQSIDLSFYYFLFQHFLILFFYFIYPTAPSRSTIIPDLSPIQPFVIFVHFILLFSEVLICLAFIVFTKSNLDPKVIIVLLNFIAPCVSLPSCDPTAQNFYLIYYYLFLPILFHLLMKELTSTVIVYFSLFVTSETFNLVLFINLPPPSHGPIA